MKKLVILAVFSIAASAATHRVCWVTNHTEQVQCGEPLSKSAAEQFVKQSSAEFPAMRYWVETEARPVNWNRAALGASAFALAAGMYDAHTTVSVLAAGGVEKNPLYGSHPSAARLYGTNIGTVAVPILLSQWMRHRHPESADGVNKGIFAATLAGGAVHLGAGIHNRSVLQEQLKLDGR